MNYLANFAWAAILLASCSREDDMIGTYEADRYHFLEMTPKVIFEKTGFVANCTLELNEDSTFVYRKTCNSIMEGYWRIQSDSLILDIHNHIWKVDSLQENGFNGRWPKSCYSEMFSIKGDHLLQIRNENPDIEGDYRVFTRLKKIQD